MRSHLARCVSNKVRFLQHGKKSIETVAAVEQELSSRRQLVLFTTQQKVPTTPPSTSVRRFSASPSSVVSSSASSSDDGDEDDAEFSAVHHTGTGSNPTTYGHGRIWLPKNADHVNVDDDENVKRGNNDGDDDDVNTSSNNNNQNNSGIEPMYWADDWTGRNDVDDDNYGDKNSSNDGTNSNNNSNGTATNDGHNHRHLNELLERIEKQELHGGRMRARQLGVLHEDPAVDMRILTENYTVASLASALRDREDVLQYCARLASNNDFDTLTETLKNFHPNLVLERRNQSRKLDVKHPLNATSLETIRKALMRMPRRVTTAHSRRAGVVIALCHVNGIPSVLLEKRSASLRAHPDEVCLPGGMVCSVADKTIVETCLREMKEEIGGLDFEYHNDIHSSSSSSSSSTTVSATTATTTPTDSGQRGISVLGVLRCNWGEVHHLVGVAVTPVVCFLNQDLGNVTLQPNPDEVAEAFTIPLYKLMDKSLWIYKDDHAPIFIGGPYITWGLTGYILERFWKDILLPFNVTTGDN